jgi:hypothetical protein
VTFCVLRAIVSRQKRALKRRVGQTDSRGTPDQKLL